MSSREHRVVAFGALFFFLLVQWYGLYFRLHAHPGPYGLNDAASYIQQINYFRELPLSNPFVAPTPINKLLHPYLYGALAAGVGLSAESMFHLSFFIGILLMGMVLVFLLKKIDSDPVFLVAGMGLFAFHAGTGNYHGFGWVVPSFYAIMLFLLAAWAIYYSARPVLYGVPLVLLMLITHSTGLYLAALLLASMVVHALLFRYSRRLLAMVAVVGVVGAGALALAEYLHGEGILSRSFSGSFRSYGKFRYVQGLSGLEFWREYLLLGFHDLQDALGRYHFAKYFYGLFTPLVGWGLYRAYREGKTPLLALFLAAFSVQFIVPFVARYPARFFYPLELLTWIVIAYGAASVIRTLFVVRQTSPRGQAWRLAGQWGLLGLSLLFVYNIMHEKGLHDHEKKFEALRVVDEAHLLGYLEEKNGKRFAAFTALPNAYLSLEGAYTFRPFAFSPAKSAVLANPSEWVVLADTHQYYERHQRGVRAYVPAGGELLLASPFSEGGSYRIELLDNGIDGAGGLEVIASGVAGSGWSEEEFSVSYPEEGAFPGITLPWYWHAETPWPLFKRPFRQERPVRRAKRYSMVVSLEEGDSQLILRNIGEAQYLTGRIVMTQLATGEQKVWDLYWGDDTTLQQKMALRYHGRRHPLLWTDPAGRGARGLLYQMERNFRDVKALAFYAESLD